MAVAENPLNVFTDPRVRNIFLVVTAGEPVEAALVEWVFGSTPATVTVPLRTLLGVGV